MRRFLANWRNLREVGALRPSPGQLTHGPSEEDEIKHPDAHIIVWRGKAYLPVQGKFKSGLRVHLGPVYTADLNVDDLVSAAENVAAHGVAEMGDFRPDEWRGGKDPILAATKASSWRAIVRNGTAYSLGWSDKGITLDMALPGRGSGWEYDPAKVRIFPSETPLADIMAVILEDIATRPELR